jgi:biotin carboxylase
MSDRPRVVLLMGPSTYRSAAFTSAAERLELDVIRGLDLPDELSDYWQVTLPLDFAKPDESAAHLIAFAREQPVDAILSVDDSATLVAAKASATLGLPHNDPDSSLAARDKYVMRCALAFAGVPVPEFHVYPLGVDPTVVAASTVYPAVVKPTRLNGSRGVIRVNDRDELIAALRRVQAMLADEGYPADDDAILIERYLPGVEVALEGLLTGGELHVLALFDKPDPLEGPFFEETIYVTPSRLPAETQRAIGEMTARSAAALGLREGPVHTELRINDEGVWPIELAGRSIGGLCSTILEFGAGMSLEELILRQAVGMELPSVERSGGAVGVMMIPIPKRGVLRCVEGQDEARAVPGVTGLEITARVNYPIMPLPEGAAYLGFIFARGNTPDEVEAALREAHERLRIRIDTVITLTNLDAAPNALMDVRERERESLRSSG